LRARRIRVAGIQAMAGAQWGLRAPPATGSGSRKVSTRNLARVRLVNRPPIVWVYSASTPSVRPGSGSASA
jgi:hypothetical protein